MRLSRFSLREQIPLLLLVAALAMGSACSWLQWHFSLTHVRETATREARDTVRRLAAAVHDRMLNHDVDALQVELAGFALNPDIDAVAVFDAGGKAILASQPAAATGVEAALAQWTGLDWRTLAPRVRAAEQRTEVMFDADTMPGRLHVLAGLHGALLYLQYDYADHLALARRHAEANALLLGLLVASSALLTGVVLHHRVTARATRLAAVAERYGRGERGLTCGLSGADELARVGHAIERMMDRFDDAQARLAGAESGQRLLIENLPGAVFIDDAERPGYTKYVSPQLKTVFGHDPQAWVEGGYDYWARHVHPADRQRAEDLWRQCCASGQPYFCEYRLYSPDGRLFWVQDTVGGPHIVVDGECLRYGFMLDVSARRQAEEAVREQAHLLKTAQAVAGVGAWSAETSGDGRMHWSEETWRLFGIPVDEFVPTLTAWLDRVHDEDRSQFSAAFDRLFADPDAGSVDLRYRHRCADGAQRWMRLHADNVWSSYDDGRLVAGVVRDVTDQVDTEHRIERLAYHDLLTGLPNRALFVERLRDAVTQNRRHAGWLAVLYADLDQFKAVNDTLGHAVGDRLLQEVSKRLRACLHADGIVARYGGDEFIVLLPTLASAQAATQWAEALCASLRAPVAVDGQSLRVSASMGIAVAAGGDEVDGEALIRHADLALYAAKNAGRDGWQLFSTDMEQALQRRRQLEHELRMALERREFVVHYQPQVDLRSRCIVGVEALLRWQHPTRGLVPPTEFIPLAEETLLILPIGEWVLTEAVGQMAAWRAEGLPPLRMAVNLSTRQFHDQALPDKLRAVLARHDVDPDQLELEVTESCVLRQSDLAFEMLARLRQLGVSIAIDDFGTGYSNLGALKQYPFARLKIDRLFIRDMADSPEAGAIVRAIFAMATALRLPVVAEGVETPAQLGFLDALGCGEVQGFHTGRPMAAMHLAAKLSPALA